MKQLLPNFSFKFLLIYFAFLLSILVFFVSGTMDSEDGWLYLGVARNIYYNQTFTAPPNEYTQRLNVNMNSIPQKNGSWKPPGGYGYSIALLPAVFLSDLYHYKTNTPIPNHFPLETDWSLLFFASFTNIFYLALLGVIMFYFLLLLNLSKKVSLLFSLLTVFCTNLLPIATFSFAHTIFALFLLLSFLFLKLNNVTKNKIHLLFALISFIFMSFTYNYSFVITIPGLLSYYFLLGKKRFNIKVLLIFVLFMVILLKLSPVPSISKNYYYFIRSIPTIFFESVWGLLFSPGKSIFLYSPLLLIPIIFWHKFPKIKLFKPELLSFLLLFLSYLFFYSLFYLDKKANGLMPIWYGGAVWGPRYLSATIPFIMLVSAMIYSKINLNFKKMIILLLVPMSAFIQLLGILVPYQVQYRGLPPNIFINAQEIAYYEYASFIPRYSPFGFVLKDFLKKTISFKDTFNNGKYNTRLYDGFDYPLYTPNGKVRPFVDQGHLVWNTPESGDSKVEILLINSSIDLNSTASAQLSVLHDLKEINSIQLPPQKQINLAMNVSSSKKETFLDLVVNSSESAKPNIFLTSLKINNFPVNINSIDTPYVDHISQPKEGNLKYKYYGEVIKEPWKLWYMRSRVYQESFNVWWIRNLYYWDISQKFISLLFLYCVAQLIIASYLFKRVSLYYIYKNEKK